MKHEPYIQNRMSQLKDGFRRAGVKLTHQRLEIFHEVAQSEEHPDAETIFKAVRRRMPTVSLDTVYRTLWLLIDLGMLTTLGPPMSRARFDANLSPHHHFVCTKCGLTRDFTSKELDRLRIPDSVTRMGRVEIARVEVRGLCIHCSKNMNPPKRGKHRKGEIQ
jgi:Fur family transcriptional regulator, peroxide stress response regulator